MFEELAWLKSILLVECCSTGSSGSSCVSSPAEATWSSVCRSW